MTINGINHFCFENRRQDNNGKDRRISYHVENQANAKSVIFHERFPKKKQVTILKFPRRLLIERNVKCTHEIKFYNTTLYYAKKLIKMYFEAIQLYII